MHPIVDTHQHLWNLAQFRLPWLDDAPHLDRSYVMDDYRQATAALPLAKAVYMEVDVAPEQRAAEAEYLIKLCEQDDNPTAGAVIAGDPLAADFKTHVDRFSGSPYIKGLRNMLFAGGPGHCLQTTYVDSIRYLGTQGLLFDLCVPPERLDDGRELAKRCPDTQFILDHCANVAPAVATAKDPSEYSAWQRGIDAVAECDNVTCKISGIVARTEENWGPETLAPIVNHCLDAFGPDRVVFGSNWPVCTKRASLHAWASALTEIIAARPDGDQRKLFHDNAVRIYNL